MGSRLTKSVERMHASYTRDKINDTTTYAEVLARLCESSTIMATWVSRYLATPDYSITTSPHYSQIVMRLTVITEFMQTVVVAFIMRDLHVLLGKYIKRLRDWIED